MSEALTPAEADELMGSRTAPTALDALADRCEAATGPDRELDAATSAILRLGAGYGWALNYPHWFAGRDGRVHLAVHGPNFQAPAYTASLDAAMTLVPEDREWVIANYRSPKTVVRVGAFNQASAVTPALALCAAALRARAHQGGKA